MADEVVVKVENDVVHTVKKSRPLGSEEATPFWASWEAVSWGAASSGVALRDGGPWCVRAAARDCQDVAQLDHTKKQRVVCCCGLWFLFCGSINVLRFYLNFWVKKTQKVAVPCRYLVWKYTILISSDPPYTQYFAPEPMAPLEL